MSKFVVVDGDTVTFEKVFGAALVDPKSGTISGSGSKLSSGATACVAGDEASVSVEGVTYSTSAFQNKGTGTLTISGLNGDQTAQKLSVGGKKAILVGTTFDATFTVKTPAQQPGPPPASDPVVTYNGKGQFVTANKKIDSA